LSPDSQIDRELLISNIKTELFFLERLRPWEKSPFFYAQECIYGIYYLTLRDFAPVSRRARRVAERMADVPRLLREARALVQSPSRTHTIAAVGMLESGEELFARTAEELGRQAPDMRSRLLSNSKAAVRAMREYREHLGGILPGLGDDFAMGKENYDEYLRAKHLLAFDSDSLLRLGQNVLAQSDSLIRVLEARRRRHLESHPEPLELVVSPPDDFSRHDVLDYYQEEIARMRSWVAEKGIATVPDYVGRLQIVETPAFLRPVLPGIAMEPPAPLDSARTSYFYVRPLPSPLDSGARQRYYDTIRRRGFRGSVVHEGHPGHHLQLSIANHHPSFIRRLQSNTVLIEGWALYCEEIVVEQGLYPDDGFLSLKWLGGVRFRAARVVLDVMLHTGRMTYEDGVRFLMQRAGADSAYASGEVLRYCLEPGQPMSYLVGKIQIMQLREELRKREGESFDLRAFHDRLLREGSIPVTLIGKKLLGN
jgi:hypothetical protein